MKKIILLLAIISTQTAIAQNDFFRKLNITVTENGQPFLNPWAGGINAASLSEIDLNGDAINDLFVFDATDNHISTFINMGTPNAVDYHYVPEYISKFPLINKWVILKDYNCDGKSDIFCKSDSAGSIALYRNDYTAAAGLQFTLITNQIPCLVAGLPDYVRCSSLGDTYPTFADVDGDGDLDILGWPDPANQRVVYYQNKSIEMGLPCDSLRFDVVTQCWGKFQLAQGSNTVAAFGLTCPIVEPPPAEKPANYISDHNALAPSPDQIVAKRDDTVSSLFAIDFENDNDMDLLVGDNGSERSLLVVNGGTNALAQMVSQDSIFPSPNSINLHSFLNHAYIDINNDGKKDIIATANRESRNNGVVVYNDTSTSTIPKFSFSDDQFLQRTMIDLGEHANPAFFDYDGDGLLDLIVGNDHYAPLYNGIHVGLALFKNTGTTSQPAFNLIDRNYADFNSLAASASQGVACAPTFGDLDGDGDKDMIVGCEIGTLLYFKNNPAGSTANFTLFNPNFASIDVGNYSMPALVDLDRDGLLDLVVGKRNGRINYYHNNGSASNPIFSNVPTNDTLGKIVLLTVYNGVTGYAAPQFYDNNGTYNLYVGDERGDILVYDSIDNNLSGTWHLKKTIFTKAEGKNTAPALADLNNDGFIDMVVGNYRGGLSIYYQLNPSSLNELLQHQQLNFMLMPNPAAAQLTIKLDQNIRINNLLLTLYDKLGRIVYQQKITDATTTINLSAFSNGVYDVQISDAYNSSNKRLVVVK